MRGAEALGPLRNVYYALRHGRSVANERGIVVSEPEHALAGYGLSDGGRREVAEKLAPGRVRAAGLDDPARVVCVSSDFLRARETAELFCALNGFGAPALDARLRERRFGPGLEFAPAAPSYDRVWALDGRGGPPAAWGCETTEAVLARLLDLVRDLERRHEGRSIVLVSHGDPLQILAAALAGLPSGAHRSIPHLATAELRRLATPGGGGVRSSRVGGA